MTTRRTYWLEHAWLGALPQALGSSPKFSTLLEQGGPPRAEGTPVRAWLTAQALLALLLNHLLLTRW